MTRTGHTRLGARAASGQSLGCHSLCGGRSLYAGACRAPFCTPPLCPRLWRPFLVTFSSIPSLLASGFALSAPQKPRPSHGRAWVQRGLLCRQHVTEGRVGNWALEDDRRAAWPQGRAAALS